MRELDRHRTGGRVSGHLRRGLRVEPICQFGEAELAGAQLSAGTVGDSYDALAETVIGLYKTELVARQGPWRTPDQLEIATLEWVDCYNHRWLHEACDYRPPAEYETLYYLNHHQLLSTQPIDHGLQETRGASARRGDGPSGNDSRA